MCVSTASNTGVAVPVPSNAADLAAGPAVALTGCCVGGVQVHRWKQGSEVKMQGLKLSQGAALTGCCVVLVCRSLYMAWAQASLAQTSKSLVLDVFLADYAQDAMRVEVSRGRVEVFVRVLI